MGTRSIIILIFNQFLRIMKKNILLSSLLLFWTVFSYCQNNDLLWVTQFTGAGQNQPTLMTSDVSGNIYVYGSFTGTVNQGAITLMAVGANADLFLGKYNKNGQIIWLKQFGGAGTETPTGLALSNDGNYIYLSGQTNGACDFDGHTITSTTQNDIFLSKYAVDGTYQWAHLTAYDTGQQIGGVITVDKTGNIIQAGAFTNQVTFYGGVTILTGAPVTNRQLFIAKYDSDGNLTWAKKLASDIAANITNYISCVSAYDFGYFFSGLYINTLSFGGVVGDITSSGGKDGFLYKTDLNGDGLFVRKAAGSGDETFNRNRGDNNGYQFLIGMYTSPTLTIDSIAGVTSVLTFPNASAGSADVFYSCYAPDGTLQYARSYGSTGDDQGLAIYPSSDHVIIGGKYSGSINFDSFSLTHTGNGDAFIVETDRNGLVLSANKANGALSEQISSSNIDVDNINLFIGEFYSNPLNIGGKTLTPSAGGLRDMFIARYGTITLSYALTNVLCNGLSTGAIDLTVTGNGTPPYTYVWSGPVAYSAATEDISGLVAGTYNVTITDALGATKTGSTTITEPSAMALVLTVSNTKCPASTDGAIDLTAIGGTSPYTFLWTGGVTTEDLSALVAATYDVTVTDVNGCTKTGSAVVANPAAMILTTAITPPSCIPGGDGAVDLTVINGTGPYTYAWSNLAVTQDISALVSGSYSVTVTDNNLCTVTGSYDVINPSAPQVLANKTELTCVPGNDGAIDVLVSGGTIPYTYVWSDGLVTTQDRIGLSAGSYAVTVTDAASCSATTATIILSTPVSPSISLVATNPTCMLGNDGAIDLIVYSGNPPYSYFWSNAAIMQDISNLAEGTYKITVTDSKGCEVSGLSIIARQFPDATITASGPTTICNGSSVQLIANTGTGLSYQWQLSGTNIPGAVAGTFNASTAGNYTVVVTSTNGCLKTSAITTVTVNPLPTATITPAGPTTFCSGGSVQLDANAGVGYTYQWQLNGTNIIGETNPSYIAIASGNYTVVVTNGGCSATSSATSVTVINAPSANITASGATTFCQGSSVVLQASVGGGYIYQWKESGTDIAGAVSSAYTANASGSYTVVVTNISGCSATSVASVVTVNSFPVLTFAVTNENCAGSNGAINLTVTNGTSPSFLWDDASASTVEDLAGLNGGTYAVTVTNVTGCSTVGSATVTTIPVLTASLNVHELVIFCASNNNGEALLNIQNGVAPFTYVWAGSTSTTASADDLGVGVSYVTVTDFCGTSIVDSIIVTSLPTMTASITSSLPASCPLSTDGSATVTAASGIAPYSYSWSSSVSISNIANDLLPGWQYVTVSDYCGSIVDSIQITNLPVLTSTTTLLSQVSCSGGNNGTALVTASDGLPPYNYLWITTEINDTALALTQGYNYVTVTDGCGSILDSVLVTTSLPLSIAITSSSSTSCIGGNNGGATVSTYNGASPITYLWSPSGNTNAFATNLVYGWNHVTVTDACTSLIDSVNITSLPVLTATIDFFVNASCPNTADGKARVTAVNGAPPYTYVWSNSTSTGYVATDLLPGWHWVTVTDQCGTAIDSINIPNLPALSLQMTSKSDVSCSGGSNGAAFVTTTNGGAPFTYLWNTGETNDTAITLIQGWNYVTVTDACGALVDSINISVTPVVTATYDKPDNILCFGQAIATIEVTPINGILPYTYAWGDTNLVTFNRDSLSAGKYYFTVTDACNSTYLDSVTINQPGALSLSMITTNVSFTGLSDGAIDLIMSGGTQPYQFDWSNGVVVEDQKDIPAGEYSITVTDNNGCVISDSSSIVTDSWHIEVYKAFTPNGDGKNDVWNIKYISAYPDCEVTIFNEWGMKVFESKGYATAWDGTNSQGKKLPAASYYYIIDLKDGSKVYTGSVALLK